MSARPVPDVVVVRGEPDAAELAAVTAVLWAVRGREEEEPEPRTAAPWRRGAGPFVAPASWTRRG
ncbi:acyl-CoA carboxylase epsilon subunit [Streptomyces sp. NPDC052042]|uniref:acyl-CoA carboxylase epsilon subunit n=1 Tax=Streptomyces sp. NPDC052042 TaxID=3365683 RepID=UPI0037D4386E